MGVFKLNCLVRNSILKGEISAIPSKSFAHRIAICNFLAGNKPDGGCVGFSSKDIEATEKCLADIISGKRVLDCGESGSTLRFLLPLCGALGGDYEFIGHGKLMERPNEELFFVMNEHGVKTEKKSTIKISGKLEGGKYKIRGDISSQYISGLLLALPTLSNDSDIELTTPLSSAPYVQITLKVLKSFGIVVEQIKNGYKIKGGQKYLGNLSPEGDWSNSAFFLVAGAVNGDITVTGLSADSVQGDKVIVDILKKASADVTVKSDYINVRKSQLKSFIFDAKDCPDLVPITAVLGAFAKGTTIIQNIERLKIKESDRIQSTINMLSAFNIKAESDGKTLTVYGGEIKRGKVSSFNDHRIAMASAVLSSVAEGESIIYGAEAVSKSYPTFFSDLKKLGGKVNELL